MENNENLVILENTATQNQTTIKTELKPKKQRDAGFEILRIIAMILIVCVHFLNYGGFIENAKSETELALLRVLFSVFLVSVNVFVLISAYFSVKSKFKWQRLLKLWVDVVIYSILFYLANLLLTNSAFDLKTFIFLFFPVINKNFWFFTAYFALSLIAPFLNKALNTCSKKEFYFLLVLVAIVSYSSLRLRLDEILLTNTGYSLIWFICLYIVGAFFRLYPIKENKWLIAFIYLTSTALIFANFYLSTDIPLYTYIHMPAEYTCPLVLIASICIFLLFKDIKFKSVKINNAIRFVSKSAFIVYLFDGSYLRDWLYFSFLKIQNYYGNIYSVLIVIAFALSVFLMAFAIDLVKRGIEKLITVIITKVKDKKGKNNEQLSSTT